MPKFFVDLFDLLRFRFQPLSHYVYPAWQPVAWLALAAVLRGFTSAEIEAGLAGKTVFFFAFTLLETMLLSLWLMLWWKKVLRRPFSGSLFPLLALCSGPYFLVSVIGLFSGQMAAFLMVTIALYSLVLLLSALAAALDSRRLVVFLAILAYLPMALMLSLAAQGLMVNWGWIVLPVSQAAG